MNILHVAYLSNSKTSGVRNVVPKYLKYQSLYSNICLLNCNKDSDFIKDKNDKYKIININDLLDSRISNLNKPFNKPDLVIFHSIYYPIYIKIYKELIKNNIPYIVVPHGSLSKNAQSQKKLKKIAANLLLFNSFLKKATRIQYLCKEEENESVLKNKKSILSGNGIDNFAKIHNPNNKDKFVITYIGRYDYVSKGLDILIEACNLIKEEMRSNNIVLRLFGNDYRGRIKKLEELIEKYSLSDIIELNGPVFELEKFERLNETDIFIQTSKSEGQSTGLLEAIGLGLPCLVTPGTNFGDIVEKYNFGYCADLEKVSISEKILESFYKKNELNKMSKNAIKYAKNNFDWKEISKDALLKYKVIINENN